MLNSSPSSGDWLNTGTYLDEALRDRFVCGLRSEAAQKKLLTEDKLTFARAVEIAKSLETATESARKLQNPTRAASGAAGGARLDVCKVSTAGREVSDSCYRCGKSNHKPSQCPFKGAKCHNCGKVGHIQRACRLPKRRKSQDKHGGKQEVKQVLETENLQEEPAHMYQVKASGDKPLEVDLTLEGKHLRMELDTGAAQSLISEKTYKSLFPSWPLLPATAKLRTYSGESLQVLGQQEVEAQYGEQKVRVPLLVVKNEGASLMGRNWLKVIQLDWSTINRIQRSTLQDVLDRHSDLFQPGLGTLRGYEAKLHVDADATPRFCKARTVPYALRDRVEQELERLTKEGIIEPVQFAEWAAPIVPVLKTDRKSVRICGDFRVTVNQVSKLDKYPIPKIEDLFAKLAGGKRFTKLDMSQAYQQVLLDKESQKYVTINTHRGLFKYHRLPFGISSAPGIFQRVMESLLQGIPGVVVYIDDVLVTGQTEEEHLATLEEVLRRMEEAGLRLRKDKCAFLAPSVVYLGHRIDAQGLHPEADKLQALQDAPCPQNVPELKSYIGLLTYYAKFLPNLSTVLAPLYKLLKQGERWRWTKEQERAFKESKQLIMSSQLLVHFDPRCEICLACDASAYGIGAVLSHKMPDGTEKPVGFASRTLTPAERNYSQVEKEALACVYGVKRFHSYLFGHSFLLQTDNEPLRTLFNQSKVVSQQASSRIQRWALTLASYEYTIVCRRTEQHANADALSRLPLPYTPTQTSIPAELVLLVENLEDAPITAAQIAQWTKQDPNMAKVVRCVLEGWPDNPDEELRSYWNRRLELSVHDGCIVRGGRVVVPSKGREHVLSELHSGHPGISRMKSLARGLVWWPGIDREIEQMVKDCTRCQQSQPTPAPAPLHPWTWPTRPWARLHMDFAGPMDGRMFLVIADAHSKWLEVIPMTTATAQTTIQQLRAVFARFGIPESIVTDNGPQFRAEEFQQFCHQNGIRHIQVAPYHPASNGLAERAVKTFKQGIQKFTTGTLGDRIACFLLQYRVTPHTSTGVSPAQLLFGRRLRTRLDAIKPSLECRVEARQNQQKASHDRRARDRRFAEGDPVFVRNFRQGPRWLPGLIEQISGPVSYRVRLSDGRLLRCHQDQVRKRTGEQRELSSQEEDFVLMESSLGDVSNTSQTADQQASEPSDESRSQQATEPPQTASGRRYPSRLRQPPVRYTD